jgi:hypothetical protein
MGTISSIANLRQQATSKATSLHNHMRDTLLHIFHTLGPLTAGWTNNHNYDVAQKPTQLLPALYAPWTLPS